MKYIRIGNDINVVWSILTDEGAPYNLGNVKLKMSCAGVVVPIEDYRVVGNKVSFTFYGKDQRSIGIYTLTLIENDGEVNMHTVDACKVFKIVSTSCEASDSHTINPEVESLTLISQVDFVKGESGGGGVTIVIDSALSTTSANPVENRVITNAINEVAASVEAETIRATNREKNILGEAKEYTDEQVGKIDIPSVEGLATKEQLNTGVQSAKDYTDEQIRNIEIPEVNLSDYATKTFVNNNVDSLNAGITSAHLAVETEAERAAAAEAKALEDAKAYTDAEIGKLDIPDTSSLQNEIQRVENIAKSKQDPLVSGTNIKTINGQPVLGEGNIEVGGGSTSNPLRALFITAGAEYNDSGADTTKTAPWGETVTHKAGHYYLNGLGDITENEMMHIYNAPHTISPCAFSVNNKIRTAIINNHTGQVGLPSMQGAFVLAKNLETIGSGESLIMSAGSCDYTFFGCTKLKYINIQRFSVTFASSFSNMFGSCSSLIELRLAGLKKSIEFTSSSGISKNSILYMIQNAVPTTAITIKLHHDAYARLTSDTEVVTALSEKNASLAGTNGKISLVCATHSDEIIPNA